MQGFKNAKVGAGLGVQPLLGSKDRIRFTGL